MIDTEPAELVGVVCARCEYDVRGLAREGRCPECGSELEISWRRAEVLQERGVLPLEMSSRRWLKWMVIGCVLVLAAAGGTLADAVFIVGLIRNHWTDGAAGLLQMACMVAGLWILGSRESATTTASNGRAVRYGIRAAAILNIAVPIAASAYPLSAANIMQFWSRVNMVHAVIGAAATVLVFIRLADGARRAGRPRLRWGMISLSLIASVLVVTQSVLNGEIEYAQNSNWVLPPEPLMGFAQAIVVVPLMLVRNLGSAATVASWAAQAGLSLSLLVTLALGARLFRQAMKQGIHA